MGKTGKTIRLVTILAIVANGILVGVGGVVAAAVAPAAGATPLSTASVIAVLARSGITTVANESSTTPLRAVTAPVGMRFTEAQVASMAQGAGNHDGVVGSTLDGVVPTASDAPPFSYLLAAWVSTGKSPGAVAVRQMMGAQNWSEAPSLVFPSIALPLFTADVMSAIGIPPASKDSARSSGGDLGAVDEAVAVPLKGLVSAPCSLVSSFMQDVLDTVFQNLRITGPTGTSIVAKVGSFFVSLWSVAVSLASAVVHGLTKALGDTVVSKIASAAAGAATVAEIVSNISPWSAKVTPDPTSVTLGGHPGSFTASVTSPGGVTYPSAVTDCASALKITLPPLSAKGATARWTLGGPLTPTTPVSVILDAAGSNVVKYETGPSTCTTTPQGPIPNGMAAIAVSRSAVKQLGTLVSNLESSMLGIAGTLVKPILQPLLNGVLSKIDSLTQITASATVAVTQDPGTGGGSIAGCPCPVGTWRVINEAVKLEDLSGGAGATWDISPDGMITINHDGSAPLTNSFIKIVYTGTEVERAQLPDDPNETSGTWTVTTVSGEVTATTTVAGTTTTKPLPFDAGYSATGSWACQANTMSTVYTGVGETVELTRT